MMIVLIQGLLEGFDIALAGHKGAIEFLERLHIARIRGLSPEPRRR